jgi:hypothetical protein
MDTYLQENKANAKFVLYCNKYGVELLKYGWKLYCDGDGVDINVIVQPEIEKIKQQIKEQSNFHLQMKDQTIISLQTEIEKVKEQIKLELQMKDQTINTLKMEIEKIMGQARSENKFELQMKDQTINTLKLEIEKIMGQVKSELEVKDQSINTLKLEVEKTKEQAKLESKLEVQLLKSEMEKVKLESKLELQNMKSQCELSMQKYVSDVSASYATIAAENKQLKDNMQLDEIITRLYTSKGANSTLKGTAGQSLIEVLLSDSYYAGAKITPCDKVHHACDLEFIWHLLKAKIEIKNYAKAISREEVLKFREDMKRSKAAGFNCGIFVSVDQPVMGEYNSLGYQWLDGMLLIYFNLNNEAVNMRYVINLAMMVLENCNGSGDEDEKVLIDSFKENYLTVESSITINEKMTKQMLGTLKLLEAERVRLFGLKDKMCKIGSRWIGGSADIVVSDSDIKVAVGSDPFTSAYEYILKNGGGDINPRPAIAKFCVGASDFDIEVMLNRMVDKAVFASLLSGTFEYFHGQGVGYITHGMLDGLSFPGKGKALNKKNYSLIKNFGCKSLDGVMQCYERWKRGLKS